MPTTSRAPLTTYVFGPDTTETPHVLAVHGLTGHGRRWESLATENLHDVRVIAPDLIGHGHSPWVPPWSFEQHLDALTAVVDEHIPTSARPFVIVGHSFGGALAVRLAERLGRDVVRGLVLLDPAQGLDPHWALEVATDSLAHWDYPDADTARATKREEGWAEVPDRLLTAEIDTHLIDLDNGRVGWRVCAPAAAAAWSEMARDPVLPRPGSRPRSWSPTASTHRSSVRRFSRRARSSGATTWRSCTPTADTWCRSWNPRSPPM
ncbi:Lipase LipV [Gordonia insulae]|uniref:Lipase LipV n=1 Tax=Gordonia insulae TaxID=2420509 RepID=A0A3G8JWK9_9ACTN|nr:Lipase LipV [Gordonia insulae]